MSTKLGKIVYGEANAHVLSTQVSVFENAGYVVDTVIGREAIAEAMKRSYFDLVILGHTLTKDDRHHLPYQTKKSNPATRVLVLHSSGKRPKVDIAIDSRDGDAAVLKAVAPLLSLSTSQRPPLPAAVAFV